MSGNGISWAICKSAPRCRQITTPVLDELMKYHLQFCVVIQQLAGGAGSSTADAGDRESEERTRVALLAWLGSGYVDHNELESRLAALAQSVADDLNSKIDSAAVLAAAAAGLHCLDFTLFRC